MRNEGLLPLGLAEGCLLSRDVIKDEAISRLDVVIPAGRLCDRLDAEQNAMNEVFIDH
jgi:predicted homoserine dehydrogenase-like protein